MADNGTVELGTATGTDYQDHARTYDGFIALSKWGTGAIVIVLILMAIFLL